jgi:hypothetical protein
LYRDRQGTVTEALAGEEGSVRFRIWTARQSFLVLLVALAVTAP